MSDLKLPPTRTPAEVRHFEDDQRSNPALHNLQVRGAYEDLQIVNQAIQDLRDRSRVPASIMAGAIQEAMQQEITRSAAFFEAAAMLFAGLPLPPPEPEEV